jgi:hypothetical protein
MTYVSENYPSPAPNVLSMTIKTAHLTERIAMATTTLSKTTEKLLFIIEAQLFHGCTRKEALMLWSDGIDTLYDSVSTQTTHTY